MAEYLSILMFYVLYSIVLIFSALMLFFPNVLCVLLKCRNTLISNVLCSNDLHLGSRAQWSNLLGYNALCYDVLISMS